MRTRCCCFCICVFAVLLNKACLQVTVEGEVGGSAVLPCSSIDNHLKEEDITVYWRHNSSQNVYDIIEGKGLVERQDPAYKNRAETFPIEYMKGNFSLKLNNLQFNDSGKYICYITKAHKNPSTQLFVKGIWGGGERDRWRTRSTELLGASKDGGNHGAATRAERIVSSLILLHILQYI